MAATHNRDYVKWQNGQDDDIQNTLSGTFAECNLLSLGKLLRWPEPPLMRASIEEFSPSAINAEQVACCFG